MQAPWPGASQRAHPAARVAVLLPALNEEPAIASVIDRIPRGVLAEGGYDVSVWVVDGRSTDATRALAWARGASVLAERGNGKGRDMQGAFAQLLERFDGRVGEPPTYFVMLDSDGTYPPERIPSIVDALEEGHDVVMGSRFRGRIETGALTALNHMGNRLLTALARLLYRRPVTDVCTGMWGFTDRFLRASGLEATGFDLEAVLFAAACRLDARVAEVPIVYSRRIGEPKLVPLRTGLLIAWRLLTRLIPEDNGHPSPVSPPAAPTEAA